MATVQNVNEQQGSNWLIPTAIGGAVGAVGGYALAPAKYSSFDELVNGAKDVFEGDNKVNEPAEGDARTAFNKVKDAVMAEQKKMTEVDKLFENNAKPDRTTTMLKEKLGVEFTDGATKDNVKLAQEVAKLAEGTEITDLDKIPEEIRKIAGGGDASKATNQNVADLLSEYGATNKVAKQAEKKAAAKEGFSFKLVKAKLELAQKRSSATNVKIAEFLNKQGDVTADELKGIAKKDIADDVKEAFEKNKKIFGKNKWLGLAVGLAGGAVVGWLASKFFGGSKEA